MKFTPDSGTVNMTFSQPDLDHKYTSSTLALLIADKMIAPPENYQSFSKIVSLVENKVLVDYHL
jgi:hypothetical protein